jgi:hypothetical protein
LGASGLRPDRAFRSNSSDLPMQILRDFRFNPLRGVFAVFFNVFFDNRGDFKMSNFEIATLDLREKADIRPLFPGANLKITDF